MDDSRWLRISLAVVFLALSGCLTQGAQNRVDELFAENETEMWSMFSTRFDERIKAHDVRAATLLDGMFDESERRAKSRVHALFEENERKLQDMFSVQLEEHEAAKPAFTTGEALGSGGFVGALSLMLMGFLKKKPKNGDS